MLRTHANGPLNVACCFINVSTSTSAIVTLAAALGPTVMRPYHKSMFLYKTAAEVVKLMHAVDLVALR